MFTNCHSCYSLRYGVLYESELLELCQQYGAETVVLTDVNNTSACLNFIRLAPKYGINPLIGIDFRDGARQLYVGIAKNNEGFRQLNHFLSKYKNNKISLPEEAPELQDVYFIYPYEQVLLLDKLIFRPNEYIGISIPDLKKLRFSRLQARKDKFIVLNSFSFRNKRDFNTHRLLRAIDNNMLLSKLPATAQAAEQNVYLPIDVLRKHYEDEAYILKNTEVLLEQCTIFFDFSANRKHQNKKLYGGSAATDGELLVQLCQDALPRRYPVITDQIKQRLAKELHLIQETEYVPFFLINWDIVSYARGKGYFHVGRGSGANSIVAYLLGITDVDPIELDLYFERFMNLYRSTPPDFDIDFSWRDREDVTRYIFEKFGKNGQAALLATYNTFKHKGATRELGKVFGLPKREIDRLSAGDFNYNQLDKLSRLVIDYAQRLLDKPNYLSVHSAGIIISEKPLHYFTATDMPPKGFPTTQFDMIISEDVGLYKYDILGQRGLGKIKDTLSIVKENQPNADLADIHNVRPLLVDKKINDMISRAECNGCFYVESPAMRMLLKKLEVDNYLGLVAASSIIRPGVAKSGMMREYILRHKNPERRKEAHPVMWELMEETYGVMVYQEDVIKVAHHFAGLTLGEADVLRRGMSGKYRSREEFQSVKEKFIQNCRAKGYPDSLTFEVWRQTESFAGYAFAKGHSASYAVESYQSLYLKAYFPLEYMVSVLNNGGGFYAAETYIHEARMQGATVHAPCVNRSKYETTIYGKDIYLGFQHLSGLETQVAVRIMQQRMTEGDFKSFDDFMDRVVISIEQLDILVRIDAFRFTGVDKRTTLWRAHYAVNHSPKKHYQKPMFKVNSKNFELPTFTIEEKEAAFDQIEILGFPLCNPFELLAEIPACKNLAKHKINYVNRQFEILGYLVTVKSTTTVNKDRMQFGTFLDQEGHWIDTVHFPPVAARYPFRGRGIYKLRGKISEEFGFLTLEVSYVERLAYMEDPRFALEGREQRKAANIVFQKKKEPRG